MGYLRKRVVPVALVSLVGTVLLAGPGLLGIHRVEPPPAAEYDLADYREALALAVTSTGVRYTALKQNPAPLARFLGALARVGPKSTPRRFATAPEQLAYALNAYNALVLHGVLAHGIQGSVHQVHGPIEPVPGFGFFYSTRFVLDGEDVHLHGLEGDLRAHNVDARIHAVLNCASRSCPPLGPVPFEAATLDAQLEAATRAWVSDPKHVRVDEDAIVLNPIFDWYADDFRAHTEKLHVEPTVTAWIAYHLPEPAAEALRDAAAKGLPLQYFEYDWSLNAAN